MKTPLLLVSLLACFVSFNAEAEDSLFKDYTVSIGLSAYTRHLLRKNEHGQQWNEDNNGAFLEVSKNGADWGLLAGSYNNSYFVRTNLLGVSYRPVRLFDDRIKIGAVAGVVSGYNKPVMLALSIKVKITETVGVHVMAVPTVGKNSGVVSSQITVDF